MDRERTRESQEGCSHEFKYTDMDCENMLVVQVQRINTCLLPSGRMVPINTASQNVSFDRGFFAMERWIPPYQDQLSHKSDRGALHRLLTNSLCQ
eukprot:6208321-Amphidinium_carterae.1